MLQSTVRAHLFVLVRWYPNFQFTQRRFFVMAATEAKVTTETSKVDLFEDDDEFEEFETNQDWDDKEEGNEVIEQWEDDWDDDDVSDDFSLQLRRELESNAVKS
ncbi:hypothetical protein MKW98_021799 [Papaver atlanticum]|uniref:26S proteasome complex subunit SEM1 n=1 Tax=Papaver atlanticum TaxID=357466 RepID=A0AAD4X6Y5_9MAGN|nr:hypothetical protein MKW98_021799 [Papaver atlanticum]